MEMLASYLFVVAATLSTVVDVKSRDIRPADALGWSWRQSFKRFAIALMVWEWFLIIGFLEFSAFKGWMSATREWGLDARYSLWGMAAGALLGGVVAWRWHWRGWHLFIRVGALMALATEVWCDLAGVAAGGRVGLTGGTLAIGALVAVFGGFNAGIDETRARRTGAWFWVRVPLLGALAIALVLAGVFIGAMVLTSGADGGGDWLMGFGIALVVGGAFGFVAFFRFGGFQGVQHFVLRRLLARSGRLPMDASSLLDRAAQMNLLQKVGFGYRFIHALLLEYFAEQETKTP
jgi:hypothetical protein